MKAVELIQAQKLELNHEYERIRRNIQDSQENLLKTEGALLMLQHLEKELDKEVS